MGGSERDVISSADSTYIELSALLVDLPKIELVAAPAEVVEDIRRDWWLWGNLTPDESPNPLPLWWKNLDPDDGDVRPVSIIIATFALITNPFSFLI